MAKLRRMKLIELCLIAIFAVILVTSVLFAMVVNRQDVSVALFLIDFPIAVITAFYASLSIREEEEEKS